ncbi:MAG: hypothetical protein GXO88_07945 [Chlorobi bacterium]|nr:hypothetical protein [Chlorobiota bacterium]
MAKKNTEGENLSRIKEILFGEDLSSIEERFERFKTENLNEIQKLEQIIKSRFDDIEKQIAQGRKSVEKAHENAADIHKIISKEVKNDISKVELDIIKEKTRVDTLVKKMEDKTSENIKKFSDDVLKSVEDIKKSIEVKLNDIYENKADNELIANIFQDISEKLRKKQE